MRAINSITLCWFVNMRNLLHCDMKKGLGPLALYKSGNKLIKVKHFQKDTCHLHAALGSFQQKPYKTHQFLSCCPSVISPHPVPTTATCAIPSSLSCTSLEQLITSNSKSFSLFCSLLLCHLCVMFGMVGKQSFELPEAQHRIAATSLPSW